MRHHIAKQTLTRVADVATDNGFRMSIMNDVEPHCLRYVFSFDDARLGQIEMTCVDVENDDYRIRWECKWYTMVDPVKGEYRGLYEHDIGDSGNISRFLGELCYLSIPGEKRRRRDLKIKQLKEERETL